VPFAADLMIRLAKLVELRPRVATARTGLTVEQILDEDRGD